MAQVFSGEFYEVLQSSFVIVTSMIGYLRNLCCFHKTFVFGHLSISVSGYKRERDATTILTARLVQRVEIISPSFIDQRREFGIRLTVTTNAKYFAWNISIKLKTKKTCWYFTC